MKNTQKGFGAVETVLIFVVVGIIGFAGWFVWNSQKQTDKTLTDASKGSSSVSATKTSSTTSNTTDTTTTKTDTASYLVVKEWGIKIPMPSDDSSYAYSVQDSTDIWVTSQSLNQALAAAAKSAGEACGIAGIQVFRTTRSNNAVTDTRKYSAEINGYVYGLAQGALGGAALAPCDGNTNLTTAISQTQAALASVWDKVAAQ